MSGPITMPFVHHKQPEVGHTVIDANYQNRRHRSIVAEVALVICTVAVR